MSNFMKMSSDVKDKVGLKIKSYRERNYYYFYTNVIVMLKDFQ